MSEQPVKSWPIKGYWIAFNPDTHVGIVGLQLDNDADPDKTFENLSANDVAALAAILTRGGAEYRSNGLVVIKA